MNILSIQSEVVYGYVGQRAARFAIERLGHIVWPIPTVILSNHTGYAHVEGEAMAADFLFKLAAGLLENGWLKHCDAVLSGYLGSAGHADMVADIVRKVKSANPGAIYCLDPVFGDDGRAYAKPGVAEAMARRLLPLADVVTPNAFELASLTSTPVREVNEALIAARRLGRPTAVATSVPAGAGRIGTLAAGPDDAWLVTTPKLDRAPHGAGDLFAALFLVSYLEGHDRRESLMRAVSSVFAVLERSVAEGSNEMLLIQSHEELLHAPERTEIRVERIA